MSGVTGPNPDKGQSLGSGAFYLPFLNIDPAPACFVICAAAFLTGGAMAATFILLFSFIGIFGAMQTILAPQE
jgi:hypothetical protein